MIIRDFQSTIAKHAAKMEVVILWGPRQTGKTTLLSKLTEIRSKVFLDDLRERTAASNDPALFLDGHPTPVLIDECAYAPELFPEIKLRVDQERRERLDLGVKNVDTKYFLTGSSKSALDKRVKESLAGRVQLFTLSGLSISEIQSAFPKISIPKILFRGGLPELYNRIELNPIPYLNDYITSYIEKDIARAEGMGKIPEFLNFLRLLGGRTGQFLNFSELANVTGVSVPTIQSWCELLAQNKIISLVPSYSTNLTKRLIKMKKLYFFDVGLATRLQGHNSEETLWSSPQVGGLFETFVFTEIIKIKENFLKDWNLYSFRTKEKEEMDFVLELSPSKTILIEVKLASQKIETRNLGPEAKKVFGEKHQRIIVTAGNRQMEVGNNTTVVPIFLLKEFLLKESKEDFFSKRNAELTEKKGILSFRANSPRRFQKTETEKKLASKRTTKRKKKI